MKRNRFDDGFCPAYHQAVELIGRRWTGTVLFALLSGATRFVEIRQLVPHLSDKVLSALVGRASRAEGRGLGGHDRRPGRRRGGPQPARPRAADG